MQTIPRGFLRLDEALRAFDSAYWSGRCPTDDLTKALRQQNIRRDPRREPDSRLDAVLDAFQRDAALDALADEIVADRLSAWLKRTGQRAERIPAEYFDCSEASERRLFRGRYRWRQRHTRCRSHFHVAETSAGDLYLVKKKRFNALLAEMKGSPPASPRKAFKRDLALKALQSVCRQYPHTLTIEIKNRVQDWVKNPKNSDPPTTLGETTIKNAHRDWRRSLMAE